MTREGTKELIKVMQAFAEGKKIQCKEIAAIEDYYDVEYPDWDWYTYEYRIAPDQEELKEKHYLPYTMEEFVEEMRKHDGFVRQNHSITCVENYGLFVSDIASNSISFGDYSKRITFNILLEHYVWSDDLTPCGKEVTE